MDYKNIVNTCEESKHLISMTPLRQIVEAGYYLELNETSTVLDLCCGYGEMLKVWCEGFGIKGIGVDASTEFIEKGKERLYESGISDKISLEVQDVKKYEENKKYDVACIISASDVFGGFEGALKELEKYIKVGGKIVIGEPYFYIKDVPRELIEFEGDLHTQQEIYNICRKHGYYITYIAGCTHNEWERYITWGARRDIERLRKNPNDQKLKEWIDKWYSMYFNYRREFEGFALFVLEKL